MTRLLLLLALVALSFVSACKPPAPGEGPVAEKGYAASRDIIAALDKFHTDNGKYPQHLDELVPKYLEANPQRGEKRDISYLYHPEENGNSYGLRFGYTHFWGMDNCAYDPKEKTWRCGGAM